MGKIWITRSALLGAMNLHREDVCAVESVFVYVWVVCLDPLDQLILSNQRLSFARLRLLYRIQPRGLAAAFVFDRRLSWITCGFRLFCDGRGLILKLNRFKGCRVSRSRISEASLRGFGDYIRPFFFGGSQDVGGFLFRLIGIDIFLQTEDDFILECNDIDAFLGDLTQRDNRIFVVITIDGFFITRRQAARALAC